MASDRMVSPHRWFSGWGFTPKQYPVSFAEEDTACAYPECAALATHDLTCNGALVTGYCDDHIEQFEWNEALIRRRNVASRKAAAEASAATPPVGETEQS